MTIDVYDLTYICMRSLRIQMVAKTIIQMILRGGSSLDAFNRSRPSRTILVNLRLALEFVVTSWKTRSRGGFVTLIPNNIIVYIIIVHVKLHYVMKSHITIYRYLPVCCIHRLQYSLSLQKW